jgi:hypothetical protein
MPSHAETWSHEIGEQPCITCVCVCACVYICVCVRACVCERARTHSETWSNENEEYLHTVCNEEEASSLVREYYPELTDVFDKLVVRSRMVRLHVL